MDMNEHRHLLVQEARELLQDMQNSVLQIELSGPDPELINAVFRAAHTIKGSSGLFGLDAIVEFTHVLESVLVRVRSNELGIDKSLTNLTLACGDHIGGLIDCVENGSELEPFELDHRKQLLRQLQAYLGEAAVATLSSSSTSATGPRMTRTFRLKLRFNSDVLTNGMDPLAFIQHLTTLGEIASVITDVSALPTLREIDPERCYLAFALEFRTTAEQATVAGVFDFVRDDSDIVIEEINAAPVLPVAVEAATPASAAVAGNAPRDMLVKVKSSKLDELIDVVGELVTRMAGSHAAVQSTDPATLKELFQGMNELVEQIRDRALNLRMVPIGEVFQRFPRLVRDVSQEIGKQIDLEINGAETELDKSMVEKLADPLVHIVRNAMDHGIEASDQRSAAGKSARGHISLNAFHQSGSVVIEIRDDGRGLNKARIFAKAVERGLVAADARLADKEIFELIFLPGFSTAEKVTDLSGRGVGMDVVRRNIDALRGSIDIHSEEGRGTTMQIRLPLTLAIIDGFQVAVGDSDFVLPLSMVEECLDLQTTAAHQKIFDLRGQPLPYIRLADIFQLAPAPLQRQCLVVVKVGESRAGIIVDRFVGELQAVIKPLGQLLQGVAGFSGSTILGDGRVALLLDIPMLLAQASQRDAGHGVRDFPQSAQA
jgi:two-component system, chemotaxis family, sensor kinase CheA